ncbi:hypothetical protein ACWF94_12565 [Streptomyces sp. NPDC055078]
MTRSAVHDVFPFRAVSQHVGHDVSRYVFHDGFHGGFLDAGQGHSGQGHGGPGGGT